MYVNPDSPPRTAVTVPQLHARKRSGEKIVVVTAYDASFAMQVDAAGIDVVLVGDSLGNVVQGRSSTLPVTLDDMSTTRRSSRAASSTRCWSPTCRS